MLWMIIADTGLTRMLRGFMGEKTNFFFKTVVRHRHRLQGSAGVTVPEHFQGPWRCGTEGHGSVGTVGMG